MIHKNIYQIFITQIIFLIFCSASYLYAAPPIVLFSDMTDGPVTGWEQSASKGAAVSIWCRNVGSSRGSSYVKVGGVKLTSIADYAEWGATTKPIVPLGMQRITFYLNSSMTTTGMYPNTTISVVTSEGESESIPFHCRDLGNSQIYFLDNAIGSNANSGLTPASAKRTTGWARKNLKAGDVCYLKGGRPYRDHDTGEAVHHYGGLFSFATISGSPNHNNGTSGKSITVAAYPGELVEWDATGNGTTGTMLKYCIRMNYGGAYLDRWTFSKFKMNAACVAISFGGNPNGYQNGGSDHLRIIGCDGTTAATSDVSCGCVVTLYGSGKGMDNLYMLGNYFHDQCADFRGQDTGRRVYQVYIGGYGHLGTLDIGWNEMGWGSQGRGFQAYGHLVGDTLDLLNIHHNWFHDNSRQCVILGGGDGGSNYEFIKQCYFNNNIVSNPADDDVAASIGGISWGRHGGEFYVNNNVFYKQSGAFPVLQITGQIESCSFYNNIVMGPANTYGYYTYYPDAVSENLTGDHNLYFGNGVEAVPSWDKSELISSDPQFVSATLNNYNGFMLKATSPARDEGTIMWPSNRPGTDFLGIPRPQGDGPDIGAFEYVDGGGSVTLPQAPQSLRIASSTNETSED